MININELRIGSYYNYDNDSIKLDGSTLASYLQNDMDFYLYPIPLTEEWKEKIKDNKFLFIDSQGFVIFKNGYPYSFVFEDYPFIHQFQNLYFSLTNEELKYEL